MPAKRPNRHKNSSVCIGYVRPSHVPGQFLDDLTGLILWDAGNQGYLAPPGGTIAMRSSPRVAEARSQVIDEYLKPGGYFAGADWFLWLDADAAFNPTLLTELMNFAHVDTHPIVGALAFGGSSPDNLFPTVYSLKPPADGQPGWDMDRETDYPRDALVKVGATGCHCVLIHKRVFMEMAVKNATLPNGKPNPYPWYGEGAISRRGVPIGEDVMFCINAFVLGIPVHVHTGIKTGHVKEVSLTEELWDSMAPQREAAQPELKSA